LVFLGEPPDRSRQFRAGPEGFQLLAKHDFDLRTWVAAVAKGVLPTGRPILRRLLSSPAARQAGQLAATVSNLSSTRMALVVAYRRIKGCK
jgi:hypothetical protein